MVKEQHSEEESSRASEGSDSSDESASDASSSTEATDEVGHAMGERFSSGSDFVDARVSGGNLDPVNKCGALEEIDLLKDDLQRKQLVRGT